MSDYRNVSVRAGSFGDYGQRHRDRTVAAAKADAALCDCWKTVGPLCAKCKLRQATTEQERERLRALGLEWRP